MPSLAATFFLSISLSISISLSLCRSLCFSLYTWLYRYLFGCVNNCLSVCFLFLCVYLSVCQYISLFCLYVPICVFVVLCVYSSAFMFVLICVYVYVCFQRVTGSRPGFVSLFASPSIHPSIPSFLSLPPSLTLFHAILMDVSSKKWESPSQDRGRSSVCRCCCYY